MSAVCSHGKYSRRCWLPSQYWSTELNQLPPRAVMAKNRCILWFKISLYLLSYTGEDISTGFCAARPSIGTSFTMAVNWLVTSRFSTSVKYDERKGRLNYYWLDGSLVFTKTSVGENSEEFKYTSKDLMHEFDSLTPFSTFQFDLCGSCS